MHELSSLLQYRSCPNCGCEPFDVLFESNLGDGDFCKAVDSVYLIPGGKYGRHVKCKVCNLIYVNPIAKAGRINEGYSQRKSLDAAIIAKARLHASKAQVELVKKFKVAACLLSDVGCGEGFFLFNASQSGYVVKGVELSQEAAAHGESNFGLDIEVNSFENLTFPENYFDVVTMWQVLEHLPYPSAVLEKAYKILRPGGMLLATTPDIESPLARMFGKNGGT